MGNILVAGSIAYDHLMTFDGAFKDSILTEKDLTHLSVSFLAKTEDFYFGGCAPNIAYGLALLGDKPSVVGVAGSDFTKYQRQLNDNHINTDLVDIDKENVTAAAYILTDKNQGQIAIFYPGAINNIKKGVDLHQNDYSGMWYAIVSPELPLRMAYWAMHFKSLKIPFIFDPGQAIPALSKEQMSKIVESADGMIFNEYEAVMIEEKTGLNIADLALKMRFVIRTLGADGCECHEGGHVHKIPAITNIKVVDSTGCGDSFRSGFMHGITNGFSIKRACEMGCTTSSFAIEVKGTQNHRYTLDEFNSRLIKHYGK
jgi:adenosine kinase